MYIEMCYKSLYNAIVRREHEKMENRCLLDKKQRIDAIALHMRKEGATDEQVAEVCRFTAIYSKWRIQDFLIKIYCCRLKKWSHRQNFSC